MPIKCQTPDCGKTAYFNLRGEPKGKYCSSHKTPEMMNVVDKLCENPGCVKRAMYADIQVCPKPKFCIDHKTAEMINVKGKRCAFKGCFVIPIYNYENETVGKYCGGHKLENMVNVIGDKCIHPGCKTNASFAQPGGETKKTHCAKHRLDGMIDIKHNLCDYEGCKKMPSFRFEDDPQCRRCKEHCEDGMIDGKHRKCIVEGCQKVPSFGNPADEIPNYCGEHKTLEMVDLAHRKCEFEGCMRRPLYNVIDSNRGIFCSQHRDTRMVDVVNKTCKSEWCYVFAQSNKNDGYCMHCYVHLFPEKAISKNYKTKELSVVNFIQEKFPQQKWVFDKIICNGVSRRRPDILLDLKEQVIIIEIDENQHFSYDCSCENKRIMELSQDVGHRPIVFIRFNPDSYICKTGTNVSSCWYVNKTGKMTIRQKNQNEWEKRLEILYKTIEYWMANRTDKTVEIIQLFYDGCEKCV